MGTMNDSKDWWFDFGETMHVCNDKKQFTSYTPMEKEQQVLMGNHNIAVVLGTGIVELQFTFGKKLTLINVLYIPDIRKNLV